MKCPECEGTGYIIHIEDPENGVWDEYEYECYECKGTGEVFDKWEILKEKVEGMVAAMELFHNDEARKAYEHVLSCMDTCELLANGED